MNKNILNHCKIKYLDAFLLNIAIANIHIQTFKLDLMSNVLCNQPPKQIFELKIVIQKVLKTIYQENVIGTPNESFHPLLQLILLQIKIPQDQILPYKVV